MPDTPTLAEPSSVGPFGVLTRALGARRSELPALATAFSAAAAMFSAYSMLRPVRDALGITSGFNALPGLFWATFVGMLLLQPLYGWVLGHYPRARSLPLVYAFFAASLVAFHVAYDAGLEREWLARGYFVWISVLNLFLVAVFWSLMSDVFSREQATRLFGCIAGGISLGGLIGPLLATLLVPRIGSVPLLSVAASLLLSAALLMRRLARWQAASTDRDSAVDPEAALRGSAFAGFVQVARSPYLRGVAVFVLLLTTVSTVLYLEQQRVVGAAVASTDERTVLFARIDFTVQALSLIGQVLLFGRILRWFGFTAALVAVPLMMLAGFALLGLHASLATIVATMLVRRVGEFALTRPCRDLLMTVVTREERYNAKSLIDTFIYRGGDAMSATAMASVAALSATPGRASAIAGVLVCAAWSATAWWVGRRFEARAAGMREPRDEATAAVDAPAAGVAVAAA